MMKTLSITSPEVLDARVAEECRTEIKLTALKAEMDEEVARVQKSYAVRIATLAQSIDDQREEIKDYCVAHRAALFPDRKSRETASAVFGFELTPPRVEPNSKKVKWKDVVSRLLRLPWGGAYVTTPVPNVSKVALLADRERLTPEQCLAAGIQFCQDENLFIRPKAETADGGVVEAKG